MKKSIIILFICLVLLLFLLVGCKKQVVTKYVCFSGLEVPDKKACIPKVIKQQAEQYSSAFVNAYTSAISGQSQLVNAYQTTKGNWKVSFVVTGRNFNAYQTVVEVDGNTGQVNCTSNCQYIKK